jgi:hypothetical protein
MQNGIDSWNEERKQEAEGVANLDPPFHCFDQLSRKNISKELEPRASKIGNL